MHAIILEHTRMELHEQVNSILQLQITSGENLHIQTQKNVHRQYHSFVPLKL